MDISIHAPTRGATRFIDALNDGLIFQSTLPRGERLLLAKFLSVVCEISIHAPTRGATLTADQVQQIQRISIHAPTRGATCANERSSSL